MNDFYRSEVRLIVSNSLDNDEENIITLPNKQIYLSFRKEMIQYLKKVCESLISQIDDQLEIFYLSAQYLDIISLKNRITIKISSNRKMMVLASFIISLKFVGNFDIYERIIKRTIRQEFINYSNFEARCMYLLDYNLIYTTVFNYLNMILYDSNPKILYTCKSILYSFIENESFINYNPFSIAISIYKYSRQITGLYRNNFYNKYFNENNIEEIENLIKEEFKEINNCYSRNNSSEEDMQTMSSTMDERRYKQKYSISNKKNISCKRIVFNDKKSNISNSPILNVKKDNNIITNNILFSKKRNNSSNNILNNNIIYEFNSINKRMKLNPSNRIGISLKQVSNLPFEKLAKLSIRYLKTEK